MIFTLFIAYLVVLLFSFVSFLADFVGAIVFLAIHNAIKVLRWRYAKTENEFVKVDGPMW